MWPNCGGQVPAGGPADPTTGVTSTRTRPTSSWSSPTSPIRRAAAWDPRSSSATPGGSAGCPLGNLIPEWNDLVRRGRWDAASARRTPPTTFRVHRHGVRPAPCEARRVCCRSRNPPPVGSVTIDASRRPSRTNPGMTASSSRRLRRPAPESRWRWSDPVRRSGGPHSS